jgi:hypothetical protein
MTHTSSFQCEGFNSWVTHSSPPTPDPISTPVLQTEPGAWSWKAQGIAPLLSSPPACVKSSSNPQVEARTFFFFLQCWGLNSGPDLEPPHSLLFVMGFSESLWNYLPVLGFEPRSSASCVARSHQSSLFFFFFSLRYGL